MKSKAFLITFASLGLFILSLYPFHLWPLNWIAWGLLISIILDGSLSWRNYNSLILFFSFFLFLYIGWKIWNYDEQVCILSISSAILSLVLTLLIFRWMALRSSKVLIAIPCAWILIHTASEYFPLATITLDILFDAPSVCMQIASLTGIKLYHAVMLGLISTCVFAIQNKSLGQTRIYFKIYGLLFFLLIAYGALRLHFQPISSQGPKTALVQHNLTPDVLWRINNNKKILQTYADWAVEARKNNAELIVFPQYDIGKDTFRSPQLIADLAKEIGVPMIFSSYIAVSPDADNDDFKNIAFLYAPDGSRFDFYESVEPFPFRRNPPISARFYRPLQSPWGLIGMHVCYENALARVVRKSVKAGALVHMDLANPGFFNDTVIPQYHLLQDRLRAIETGQYVYRVTTNGNSGIIDPRGRIEQLTKLDEANMLMTQLRLMPSNTFYLKAPYLLPIFSFLILAFCSKNQKKLQHN